ncbi:MAG: Crp/Fnr family transcriptional regulator [Burkholderiales bacterium]|nr:Crp/Fnr family transcriptional regulator [Burkholderiales bacterium]
MPANAEVLGTVPLFAGLPEEGLAVLARGSAVRRVPRGAYILRAGERTDGVHVILSGSAKVLISDAEGREVILALIGRHEFFGEMGSLDEHPRSASVRALEPCELLRVARADFLHCLLENRAVAMRVMLGLVRRLREADRQIESLALMSVHHRVVRILRDLSRDEGGRRVIPRAPPKQEIAHMIGASREMVSRVLRELVNLGRIRVEKRRIVLLGETAQPCSFEGEVPGFPASGKGERVFPAGRREAQGKAGG